MSWCTQQNLKSSKLFAVSIATATWIAASPASGQTVGPGLTEKKVETPKAGNDEIIVTAQRRSERLSDVPIAVSAFNANQLATFGVNSTIDLAIVTPGMQFGTQAAYGQPFLRGIGTTATGPGVESPVALYVDGVYYGAMIGSVMTLNNVEQIEVLKGPQGTLFGRNATGGLIQITTKDPSQQPAGSITAGYGNYRTGTTDIYLTGGVASTLAGDVAVHFQDQGKGFGTNLFTGNEVNKTLDLAVRSKWLWTPSAATTVRLSVDYQHQKFRQAYVPAPGTKPPGDSPYTGDPQGLNGIFDPDGRLDQGGISLQIKHSFGSAELISTSAYRASKVFVKFDGGLTRDPRSVLNLQIFEKHTQLTQELQLNSTGAGDFQWSTGLYLFHAYGKSDPLVITTLGAFGPAPDGLNNIYVFSKQKTDSIAIYGQTTVALLPATNLTTGVRFTTERRQFEIGETLETFTGARSVVPAEQAKKTFSKMTWRLALDTRLSPNAMIYGSYNRGFKAGGFNDYLTPPRSYQPETLDAYEVGAKTDFLSKRLHLNAALFFYDYKNIQTVEYPLGVEIIRNAARARLYGVDIDAQASLGQQLTLTAGLEYLHDRFTSFPDATIAIPLPGGGTGFTRGDVAGRRLGLAPDYTLSASLIYKLPTTIFPQRWGTASASATWNHNAGFFAEPENRLQQPAYNLLNAEISWTLHDKLTSLIVWGNNLTQATYAVALASQDTGDFAIYAPPRTYGFKIERRF